MHGPHPAQRNLLGIVSLYGFMTHTVVLAENYPGPWPTPHAHLYNIRSREALALAEGETAGTAVGNARLPGLAWGRGPGPRGATGETCPAGHAR